MSEEAGFCHAIMTQDLGMDPHVLTTEQIGETLVRRHCLASVRRIRCRLFVKHHWQQTWIYGYDPETSAWKSPSSQRPKKSRQVRSKTKVLLTVFFDLREFAQAGQTINEECY
jgi:hypothetical protein